MPSSHQIDAPISLISFFPDSSESDHSDGDMTEDEVKKATNICFETQSLDICGRQLIVRQYSFHSHNANQVWPGTFNLAEYLLRKEPDGTFTTNFGSILELGTATGVLSMRLALDCSFTNDLLPETRLMYACTDIVTTDVEDEFNDIEKNLSYNYTMNHFISSDDYDNPTDSSTGCVQRLRPIHIPHTWGSGWFDSITRKGLQTKTFKTIIGSDILLYVNSYPDLVCTLQDIFKYSCEENAQFIMSWKRRMKQSEIFFDMMDKAGFQCVREKNCIFRFTKL